MHGNTNVNKKILDAAKQYSTDNPLNTFDVYICIDQERIGFPQYNKKIVTQELKNFPNFKAIFDVIAVLMIESLFFIDIDNIYVFLSPKKIPQYREI